MNDTQRQVEGFQNGDEVLISGLNSYTKGSSPRAQGSAGSSADLPLQGQIQHIKINESLNTHAVEHQVGDEV